MTGSMDFVQLVRTKPKKKIELQTDTKVQYNYIVRGVKKIEPACKRI